MIRNVHVSLFSAWNAMSANLILAKALLNIRFCTQPLHKSSAAARWRLFNWSVFMEQYSSAYSSDIERYMPVNAFPSLASCFWELREEYSLLGFFLCQCWRFVQGGGCSSFRCPSGGAVQQRSVGGEDLRQRGAQRCWPDAHHHRQTDSI